MLQASVQILVVIQVLRGSQCQDTKQFDEDITLPANISAQSLHIIDCFTEAVNISQQLSDDQALNVSHFQDISHACERNSWRIFHCNHPLMDHLEKAKNLTNESHHEEEEFFDTEPFKTNEFVHYQKATELQKQATQVLKYLIHQIRHIKEEASARNELRIFTDNCSLTFLNMDNLLNLSLQYTTKYNKMRSLMDVTRFKIYTLRYHFLPFIAVVFTFGILGNGLLLLIFVRHPKSRTGPNVMLVNLAVSDSLFLLVNIAADYSRALWGFPFGTEACYVYNFVLCLITAASVYSMTMLGLSRYIAVTAKPGSSSKRLLTSMPVLLTTVWTLSAVVAIPDTLSSKMVRYTSHTADCSNDNIPLYVTSDFLFIGFLPLSAITCFYIAASRRLQKSVQLMPGEALGQDNAKTARERGAKILPGLIFVFAITFLPYYTFCAIVIDFGIDIEGSVMWYTLLYVVYFLFNLNSALNPVALYLTSSKFRKYINNCITLGMIQKKNLQRFPTSLIRYPINCNNHN